MSGYYGYSKSNRAVLAEADGLMTATSVGRALKVPAGWVLENCEPEEWHHTSKYFTETNYYVLEKVEEYLRTEEGQASLAAWIERNDRIEVYEGSTVRWIEWSGTRNHPKATEKVAENATVVVKGQTATIILEDGTKFRKRLTTNGFSFTK